MNYKADIGVIVGRFQVPTLTEGHRSLIDYVVKNHKYTIIFIGTSPVLLSKKNPLNYISREQMIREAYPTTITAPLADCRTNQQWSDNLDKKIRELIPMGNVVLYGSRDSFIDSYKGTFKTEFFEIVESISGTELRDAVASETKPTSDFRAGIIYANHNRYPISYTTVDIAITRQKLIGGELQEGVYEVLLGRKPAEVLFRFIGGFSDPEDENFEAAARREAHEEAGGLELGDFKYLGSFKVNDWRYAREGDQIKTILFHATYVFGRAEAGDDIAEVEWFDLADFKEESIVGEHRPLLTCLKEHIYSTARV